MLAEVDATNFLNSNQIPPDRRISNVGWSCTDPSVLEHVRRGWTRNTKNDDDIDEIQEMVIAATKEVRTTNRTTRSREDG